MKTRDTGALLWLGLVLLIALSIAFLLPVTPQDYWWFLRVGHDTLASGAVPRLESMTFTRTGSPVDYQAWGAAVLFWLVYRLGGLSLTVLLRGVVVAATYTLVWATARRAGAGRLGASLVLLAAVLTSSNNWSVRPQLLVYPLFALAIFILYKWQTGEKEFNTIPRKSIAGQADTKNTTVNDLKKEKEKVSFLLLWNFVHFVSFVLKKFFQDQGQKAVYWLPLISLVWANLHGSFVMLILLVGAALVFGKGDRRSLGLAFAGVLLATLVNPHGLGVWTYVFNIVTVPSIQLFSAEWLPPVNTGWQMNIFFIWLLGFPLLAALSPRKLDRLEWTWFLGFGFLALWGERYVVWFVFILVVLTGGLLADWEKKYFGRSKQNLPAFNLVLSVVFILLPLAFLPGFRAKWWKHAPPVTENTPVAATEWLAAHPGLPGPLWSEIGFSSYLEFALPQRPTWIDTRFEVFPVTQWQTYQAISEGRQDWESLLDATGVNLLMVSQQNQPELLTALKTSLGWCELYHDDIAVIYQHCGGGR
jgi:hypothetical protein